jgi:hypothetical protein
MTDPQRPKDAPPSRRAEPLQPDNPARGRQAEPGEDAGRSASREDAKRAREQEDTALDNVRTDYR